ncbi:MAG TPA: hypothetical protein VFR99_02930 [Marmoricola sp.]|nr:hypothetical protein [Marmoricola sp.]
MRRGWHAVETAVVGMLAVVGLLFGSALVSVAVAGTLQWGHLVDWLDDAIPLAVLGLGMILAGRVAVDVAGRGGVVCSLLAAGVVAGVGVLLSRATQAHGDGVEGWQAAVAAGCVLVLTGGTAWLVQRRRRRRRT